MASRRSPGEGSISQRKDGRWQASLQVNGQRTTVYGKTRREAADKLRVLQSQAPAPTVNLTLTKRTMNELLDAWLGIKATQVKPRTLADYHVICETYLRPVLGKEPLSRISPARIQQLYAQWQGKGKARTALKIHQVLSQAMSLAVRWDWLGANPCDRVDRPRYHAKRKELWTLKQLRAFLDGTREHWVHSLWVFVAYSGCRLGEALALLWTDVDLATGRVVIAKSVQRINGEWVTTEPKTRAGMRVITLPAEAVSALRRQAERRLALGGGQDAAAQLVFVSADGGPLSQGAADWHMRKACEHLGLPRLSPHGLRHLHASLLLVEGLPLPEVSRRLGHANPSITASVYSHAVRDDTAAAKAIERALAK